MRHGQAESYFGANDSQRKLTEKGVQEAVATAKAFCAKGASFDVVFVSPYTRAQQTAQAFLSVVNDSVVGEPAKVINASNITPEGNVFEVASWLTSLPHESILLITHQPFASLLIEFLSSQPLPARFTMPTAALVVLEGDLLAGACCRYDGQILPS